MKIRFNTHSLRSSGLLTLKRELTDRGHDVKLIKHHRSQYRYRDNHILINWGIPRGNFLSDLSVLNKNSSNATNKLVAHQLMVRNKLRWSTDISEAKRWKLVYCRTLLNASCGRGIVVATDPSQVVPAPLYTKGITKVKGEFRVHVFKGQVIDYVQKLRMNPERLEHLGIEVNPHIRNHENGYVFARQNILDSEEVKRAALEAVEDLQLDFGAVDVVLSGYSLKAFVIEVNTAPGIEGSTVGAYADAIEALVL